MTSRITFLVPIVLFALACSDENPDSLEGKWELRHSTGGLLPDRTYEPGSGHYIRFSADTVFESVSGGQREVTTYRLEPSTSLNSGTPMEKLILEGKEDTEIRIKVDGDQLTLEYGTSIAADGTISKYQKVKDAPASGQ